MYTYAYTSIKKNNARKTKYAGITFQYNVSGYTILVHNSTY